MTPAAQVEQSVQVGRPGAPPRPAPLAAPPRSAPMTTGDAASPAEEIPDDVLQMQEEARELSRKLGRPLRAQIPDPLSEADWEELILARMLNYDKCIPAEELLAEFGRRPRKPRK